MSPTVITILIVIAMFVGLCSGLPIALALGSIGVIFTFFLWGPHAMGVIPTLIFGKTMMSFGLLSIPLFILMGLVLQHSGMAEKLFRTFYMWSGRLNGGLAVAAVVVCTLFAAMTGIGGAGTVTMGLVALPAMMKRNYNLRLALGAIASGGALGILIPPSIIMIIYGMTCQVSVGRLFAGGLGPGILLAFLYIVYILVLCKMKPEMGPGVPEEELATFKEKIIMSKDVALPLILIAFVLGVIFTGTATPTEGAGVGAIGSLILMLISKECTWDKLKKISLGTVSLTGMVLWIIIGAYCFATIYTALGAADFIAELTSNMPFGYWGVFIIFQILFFVLGMLLEPSAIVMIVAPIMIPIIDYFGYNQVWFGVLFVVNMQCAYITPPFGYNLFYVKSVAPPDLQMAELYKAIVPFIAIQLVAITLCAIFPQIILFLPNLIFGPG